MNKSALSKDFYKVGHVNQYPPGTSLVFSNFTPRSSRVEGADGIVFFGSQYYIKEYLIRQWNAEFFGVPKHEAVDRYKWIVGTALGMDVPASHLEDLHDLGFLPLDIWALPEGSLVPFQVPAFVIYNTMDRFYWLPNFLETALSATVWGACTSATTARRYRQIFERHMKACGETLDFVDWMGHDFSMRGMFGLEASEISGAAHLTSFTGTDTIPAIGFLQRYYHAGRFVGGSVPATEHSVMCAGGKEEERETFRRLITEVYPSGIVSIVSDTWDFFGVLTDILPSLKEEIVSRDGKVVIRPDSGDPFKIICGDQDAPESSPERLGAYRLLAEEFGYTFNGQGFRVLNPHVGLIYGDSITPELADRICGGLVKMGFVPNIVFGIGSYTYQHVTRDTYGFAMKATYVEVDHEPRPIFKDPKTGSGKKSHRGLLAVYKDDGGYFAQENVGWGAVYDCEFVQVFDNGSLVQEYSLDQIRERVRSTL